MSDTDPLRKEPASSHILLPNCGSPSTKCQPSDPETQSPLAVGIVERIGQDVGKLKHKVDGQEFVEEQSFPDHTALFAAVVAAFGKYGSFLDGVRAAGHRTVHGGSIPQESTLITGEVIAKLAELQVLAPLYNPPGIAGIEAAMALLPDAPHVAIFDTAFFAKLSVETYTYTIDREVMKKYELRRYGFRSTSHSYVPKKAVEVLGRSVEELKVIVCRLSNGASISTTDGGQAVETSMGLTPLQGLVMGTRSGNIDPGISKFLSDKGYSIDEIDTLLNKQPGMGGMCDHTDMCDVEARIDAGDVEACLAMDVYIRRLTSYIGAYIAVLRGVDAVIFTVGTGESASLVRCEASNRLRHLGSAIDEEKNAVRVKELRVTSTSDSPVKILVVPTNEELAMAQDTLRIIGA